MRMQTLRREYIKVSAPTEGELEVRLQTEDAAWRDRGYLRVEGRGVGRFGDVYTQEVVYEEAPRNSDTAQRAEAMGTRLIGPSAFGIIAIVILAAAVLISQQR